MGPPTEVTAPILMANQRSHHPAGDSPTGHDRKTVRNSAGDRRPGVRVRSTQ